MRFGTLPAWAEELSDLVHEWYKALLYLCVRFGVSPLPVEPLDNSSIKSCVFYAIAPSNKGY
jgi:hypothetical protein